MRDLLLIGRELVRLIRAGEMDAAAARVDAAARVLRKVEYTTRARTIAEVNQCLRAIKRQREAIGIAVAELPEGDRVEAQARLWPALVSLFDTERVALLAQKRRLSRPGHS